MTRDQAIQRVLGAALSHVGESEVGADNHGEQVSRFLKSVGLGPGYPWCAALQNYSGSGALVDPETAKSAWPLPHTGSCSEIGAFAAAHNVLFETPEVGDLMLFWEFIRSENRSRFAHVGLVVHVAMPQVRNVEGNTNNDGSRNGWTTLIKPRALVEGYKHRFVRWANLLPA